MTWSTRLRAVPQSAVAAKLRVEVVYALAEAQRIVTVELQHPATAMDAVVASGLPGDGLSLGIFGKRVKSGQPLKDGDRVEILRPLLEDPKEGRRRRAKRR